MIIKMKHLKGWKLFDGIGELNYRVGQYSDLIDEVAAANVVYFDRDKFSKTEKIAFIHYCSKDGDKWSLAINETCYILNDEGKTMEKIL